jgi:hypothetical protein
VQGGRESHSESDVQERKGCLGPRVTCAFALRLSLENVGHLRGTAAGGCSHPRPPKPPQGPYTTVVSVGEEDGDGDVPPYCLSHLHLSSDKGTIPGSCCLVGTVN